MTNCLVIGFGGREHALALALGKSPGAGKIFVAPGNAGTADCATNVPVRENDFHGLSQLIIKEHIGLVLVGPEVPLVEGLSDFLRSAHGSSLIIVGPGKSGARLEGSKAFSKKFMESHGIPTAPYKEFTTGETPLACNFLQSLSPPYVIKADGLAAGKGVMICDNRKEAEEWIIKILDEEYFGKAPQKVVIEKFIRGIEVSVFVLTDGINYCLLPEAKDYKRIGDNDSGPNTGGMGSVSPVPFYDNDLSKVVEETIVKKTISGLSADGIPYMGFVFIGLMIDHDKKPWVIEYNCRMGDPETQSVLERIQPNWIAAFENMHRQTLNTFALQTLPFYVVSVVLAAEGYPDKYPKGMEIHFSPEAKEHLRMAGATEHDRQWHTTGGRVLAVTSRGESLNEAIKNVYATCNQVTFEHKYYRKDIGKDLLYILQK